MFVYAHFNWSPLRTRGECTHLSDDFVASVVCSAVAKVCIRNFVVIRNDE